MRRIALASALAALLVAAPAYGSPRVVVVPDAREHWDEGAAGLLVPGRGTTVSRDESLRLLDRTPPRGATVYVSLPAAGEHRNDRRYPIAVVGPGFDGLVYSPATRIPGLVTIADLDDLEARAGSSSSLPALDRQLSNQQRSRNGAVALLAGLVVLGSLLALLLRSRWIGRAALLVAPLCVTASIVVAAGGGLRPAAALPAIGGTAAVAALALAVSRRVGTIAAALIAAFLLVLVAEPSWAALSPIGPSPSEGGRFFGTSNLTATVLLTVALLAAWELGPLAAGPVALLTLAVVAWSRAGADGGGTLVVVAAFAVYAALLARGRLPARQVALAAGVTLALAALIVGLDVATGGSSHVTRKLAEGPGAVAGEVGHRLHVSADRLAVWHAALVFAVAIAALAVLAARRPHFAAGTALLAGVAVSLLVNDSPNDVAAAGAVSYGVLFAWKRVRSSPDAPRRPALGRLRVAARPGGGLRQ